MAVDFSKFDKSVDLDGLREDIKEAQENGGGDYKEVPHGKYEVSIEKMELVESKKGDPMVSIWFNIVSGEYKNSKIFYNQVITKGFQIHLVNELLRSLESDLDVEFETYKQYSKLLLDIHENIDGKFEYALNYDEKKGYNTFSISEVFELE